jgi:hypothetical protein
MATADLKLENGFLEAPASWNTKYKTKEGFQCQLTLRAETGRELLEKAEAALAFLLENGYAPCEAINNHTIDVPTICQIHGVAMKRYEKNGKSWFSHRLEDGSWCRGKPQGEGGKP